MHAEESRRATDAFDDALIRQVFKTMRLFSRTLNGRVRAEDVHASEWMLLNLVSQKESAEQSELIRTLAVEPAAITRTIARLEAKGIFEREPNPGGRGKLVRLTQKGRAVCARLLPEVTLHRRAALANFSEAEKEELMALMRRVFENLSGEAQRSP